MKSAGLSRWSSSQRDVPAVGPRVIGRVGERYRENTPIPEGFRVGRAPLMVADGAYSHRRVAGRGHGEKGVFGGAARSTTVVAAQADRSATLRLALKGWRD